MSPKPVWTDDKLDVLRELVADPRKLSAAQIGELLHVKRNSIIGACNRNGIKLQRKACGSAGIKRQFKGRKAIPGWKRKYKFKPAEAPVEIELATADVTPRNVELMELGPFDCRYPIGDGPFLFCGNPQKRDSNYCFAHHHLCWVKPTKYTGSTFRDKPRKVA